MHELAAQGFDGHGNGPREAWPQPSAGTFHSPGSPVSFFVSSENLPAAEAAAARVTASTLTRVTASPLAPRRAGGAGCSACLGRSAARLIMRNEKLLFAGLPMAAIPF